MDSIFLPLILVFLTIFVLSPPGSLLPEEEVPPVPGAAGPVWAVLPPPEHREGSLTPQLGFSHTCSSTDEGKIATKTRKHFFYKLFQRFLSP